MSITLDRRSFLVGATALAGSAWAGRAFAVPPTSFRQGSFDISVFSDGFITLPGSIIAPDATPDELAVILKRLEGHDGSADLRVNIPLIRSGTDLILIDTGSGDKFQPSAGRLLDNMKAAGVDPASVTKVVFTHAHPDHSGGTIKPDGSLSFPNATYYVAAKEWDFWMRPDYETALPAVLHDFARGAQRDLGAVKDRVKIVRPGDDIVTGIRVLDTAGHTPGHISLEIAGGDGLIITADAITNLIVSFEHPSWRFGFDTDQDLGVKNRVALIERAATEKTRLLGYHWSNPGAGIAEHKDGAFRYVPVT